MKQGLLFQLSQPVEPAPDRVEPAVWVRRLLIVEALGPEGRAIRDISFRRGLNIIRTAERTAEETRPVGHSVGKTLLLRLIRYCLGESTFCIRPVRSAITEKLPSAYVLAEVCLDGEWWSVARPIGLDHSIGSSRALRSESADDLLIPECQSLKFSDYVNAVDELVAPWFLDMNLPSAGHQPRWLDLLAWLARDQHCRMRHALEWRDPESESGTAQLAREDASLLIRMVTGLLSEDEKKLRDRHTSLLAEQARLNRDSQRLTARLEAIETDLREGLGIAEGALSGSLLVPSMATAANDKIASLKRLLDEMSETTTVRDGEAKVRELAIAAGVAKNQLDQRSGELATALAELQQLDEADTNTFYASFAQQERWCHLFQAKDEAIDRGCPGEPPAVAPGTRDPRHQIRIDETKTHVAELRVQVESIESELANLEEVRRQANEGLAAVRSRLDTKIAGVREQIGRFTFMLEQSKRLGKLWSDHAKLQRQLDAKAKAIDVSSKRQARARDQLASALGKLSRHFDGTLKELLGEDAGGKIEIDARQILPRPNANVAASGAALGTSATVLGFDMACLIASICGLGNHPRLVLHDSPREADMEEPMYHRLFDLIAGVEAAFDGRLPSFQYIVTTTTPPPRSLRTDTYVRLTLDARSDDGLLLGMRLAV